MLWHDSVMAVQTINALLGWTFCDCLWALSIPNPGSSQNLPQTDPRRIDTELCEWVLMGVDPCEAGMSKVLRNMALELCQKLSVHPDPDNPYFFPSASTIRHIRDRENAKRRMHTVSASAALKTSTINARPSALRWHFKQRFADSCQQSGSHMRAQMLQNAI